MRASLWGLNVPHASDGREGFETRSWSRQYTGVENLHAYHEIFWSNTLILWHNGFDTTRIPYIHPLLHTLKLRIMTHIKASLYTRYILSISTLSLLSACVTPPEEETPSQQADMDTSPDGGMIPLAAIKNIEIVLNGTTPGQKLAVKQGQQLQLKVQAFDTTGKLISDNVISQSSVLFSDLYEESGTYLDEMGVVQETTIIPRESLNLELQGNIIKVLERGISSIEVNVNTADGILSDTVVLDASTTSSLFGTLPKITTLRKGEPLKLDASLTVQESPNADPVPLIPLCASEGTITTSGAITVYSAKPNTDPDATSPFVLSDDLTFNNSHIVQGDRTGIGTLSIECTKLAEYGLPTSLEYFFRVESATEVKAGAEHTCSLIRPQRSATENISSNLLCWGKNERGQVGTLLGGRRQDVTTPTQIFAASQGPIDIDTGAEHSCAIVGGADIESGTRSGNIYCWGDNRHGQSVPLERENAPKDQVSSTLPSLFAAPVPLQVTYMKFAQVCTGQNYSCALSDQGRLLCWGQNSHGQLGDATELDQRLNLPTEVFHDRRYLEVSCGDHHVCATTTQGQSECWGRNNHAQLGQDPATYPLSQTPLPLTQNNTPFNFEALFLGPNTSCGSQDNALYCWGNNRNHQISDFVNEKTVKSPVKIDLSTRTDERVESISMSARHTCAITTSNQLATDEASACLIPTLDMQDFSIDPVTNKPVNFMRVDGTCADRGTNKAVRDAWLTDNTPGIYSDCTTTRHYCWGDAQWGQAIDISAPHHPTPRLLSCQAIPPEGTPVRHDAYKTITTGDMHSCMAGRTTASTRDAVTKQISVDTKEKVWCWGRTDNGKLGSRSTDIITPSTESTFKRLAQTPSATSDNLLDQRGKKVGQPRQLAIGGGHSCIRTCLPGDNPNSESGDSCERLFDAQHHILCWGSNAYGQHAKLDGFNVQSSLSSTAPSAFQIQATTASMSHTIQDITSGSNHLCTSFQSFQRINAEDPRHTWTQTKSLRCWGNSSHGQAGAASQPNSTLANPTTGIGGGADAECQATNFPDRMGNIHTCAFTLVPDYTEYFKPKYNDPNSTELYDYASSILKCWNKDRLPNRPDDMNLNSLTFSPKGQAYCWGNGSLGQHGRGTATMGNTQVAPSQTAGVNEYFNGLASSDNLTCGWSNTFSTGGGEIKCWGADPHGLVRDWSTAGADGTPTPEEERLIFSPTRVQGWNQGTEIRDKLKAVEQMAIGESHICVISNIQKGYVVCWGDNTYGQLGGVDETWLDAQNANFVEHEPNNELTNVVQLTAGTHHTCALTSDQKLYCWGRNDRGQAGAVDQFGNVSDNLYALSSPYQVSTFQNKYIKEIKAFNDHTCALVAEDVFETSPTTVHCWGENDLGQSACWSDQSQDPDQDFCVSSTPWARRASLIQAYP